MAVTGTTAGLVGARIPAQNLLAQLFRITLAVAHKLDHELGDHLHYWVVAIRRCKSRTIGLNAVVMTEISFGPNEPPCSSDLTSFTVFA
jgi:hypothetical protein